MLPRIALAALCCPALAGCFLYAHPPRSDGAALYRRENCANCHGPARAGTPNGPPLEGLAERWDARALGRYLLDPDAVLASDPRLAELSRRHGNRMPPFPHLTSGERAELARWLLAGPAEGRR